MTEAELDAFLGDCPVLFHMAEAESWEPIRRHGLLSTSALLDLFGVRGPEREAIERRRRATSVVLEDGSLGRATIRDNGPITDGKLTPLLRDGLRPADWYAMLNRRVFFWPSRKKVRNLLGARLYRTRAHDVLEVDARALVEAYRARITLSAINSGATLFPNAPTRGLDTFLPIEAYPYALWRSKRPRGERVTELAISGGVPDIARFVRRVTRMRGGSEEAVVFERA